ncbi:MAG: Wzz/FepE/Etk N-terminal domain-containing protein [Desulfobacula sp.]|jgi:capsular polysaccharide biosynthesis protein|nr:Wzz/FepE/Etk N-terminal domain-containing protein [Desulfobacula sp.]
MADNEVKIEYKNEIELMDILFVIWRWKVFIIGVILLAIISTAIYVFSVPEIYKCSMIIKPIELKQNDSSEWVAIALSTDIKTVIGSKQLHDQIIDNMKLYRKNLYKGGLFFKATTAKMTNNIRVEYYCYKPDQGIAILNSLVVSLNEYFQPKINDFKEQQTLKISEIDIQINNYKNQLRIVLVDKTDQINYLLKEIE